MFLLLLLLLLNDDIIFLNIKQFSLMIKYKLNTNDEDQLKALKEGFYEIIPQDIKSLFDEIDLKVNFFYSYIFIINS